VRKSLLEIIQVPLEQSLIHVGASPINRHMLKLSFESDGR
jgi:hypothetical protein